jgi:predicted GTPase
MTQEVRERLSHSLYEAGREHLARRLAQQYVREVGRAAIDLYGGHLLVTREALQKHVTSASRQDADRIRQQEAEPVRILVAGQVGVGKSSLVYALARTISASVDVQPATSQYVAYQLRHERLPAALIIDSPGLSYGGDVERLVEMTGRSDLVLWVSSAARAARDIDSAALSEIREHFVVEPNRRRPPMLLILTHIDALRPFAEWNPPYDISAASEGKSRAIREAMDAAGGDLGFAVDGIVPVRTGGGGELYNIDAVWAKIIELMPEAQQVRLLRVLGDVRSPSAWRTLWSQAAGAGRVIGSVLIGRRRVQ